MHFSGLLGASLVLSELPLAVFQSLMPELLLSPPRKEGEGGTSGGRKGQGVGGCMFKIYPRTRGHQSVSKWERVTVGQRTGENRRARHVGSGPQERRASLTNSLEPGMSSSNFSLKLVHRHLLPKKKGFISV